MTQPDFLIIGAMKCGTTTLAAQLGAQQGVFMTKPKEPFYFSDDDVYARGPDWYASLFARAAPGDLKGEASTRYTMLPNYPHTIARMKAALPAPRLVYCIRNPVQRAVSHYLHEWIERRISVDIARAFDLHPELTDYGRYAMQIAPFVEAYGADAIWITSLERIKADPSGELGRIGAHIGMTATPVWRDAIEALNVSSDRSRKLPLHRMLVSNPTAVRLREALVPKALEQRIRNARKYQKRPEVPAAVRARLMEIHQAEKAALLEMNLAGAPEALSDCA